MDSHILNQLHQTRFDLKQQGRFGEAIPIQLQILEAAHQSGRIINISNAWNILSHLYQLNHQLTAAEEAARQALIEYESESYPKLEIQATYEMKLATILADQSRFIEAVQFGQLAIQHFSEVHNTPNDFLDSIKERVAVMAKARIQTDP